MQRQYNKNMDDLIAPLIASLMIYHSAQCAFHRTTMFPVFIFCTSHCLCFFFCQSFKGKQSRVEHLI